MEREPLLSPQCAQSLEEQRLEVLEQTRQAWHNLGASMARLAQEISVRYEAFLKGFCTAVWDEDEGR